MNFSSVAVVHDLQEMIVPLRIFFTVCLVVVFCAGVYAFRKRHDWFSRDPQIRTDTRAVRNLRLWQVLLVWLLAMELLMAMLYRLR